MTIEEMLNKLKELYRQQCDLRHALYSVDEQIETIRKQLINSTKI